MSGTGNSGSIQPMNLQDLVDSLIEFAAGDSDGTDGATVAGVDLMVAATESDTTAGTFTIDTSSSKTGYTEVSGSGTAIFVDTRTCFSLYSSSGIPETLDQSNNCNTILSS